MSNQLTGVLREIYEEKQPSATFTTREFVVTVPGQYEQHITLQCTQGRTALLDNLSVGDTVTVDYNLQGKQYTKKDGSGVAYFNSLVAWKIVKQGASQSASTPTPGFDPNQKFDAEF